MADIEKGMKTYLVILVKLKVHGNIEVCRHNKVMCYIRKEYSQRDTVGTSMKQGNAQADMGKSMDRV